VTQRKADRSSLAAVAEGLDAELCRYEALAMGFQRERLDSEKSLRQASRTLQELEDSEVRLGQHLQSLVAAIGSARERQEQLALAVQERARQMRQRSTDLADLLARWEALGKAAADVNRLVQQVASTIEQMGGEAGPDAVAFREIDDRLGRLADDSQELSRAAEAEAFVDLGKLADSLRLRLLSARNRFRILDRRRASAGEG
jgi:septal ring factor EnvC (AmiA/AmiB activator)